MFGSLKKHFIKFTNLKKCRTHLSIQNLIFNPDNSHMMTIGIGRWSMAWFGSEPMLDSDNPDCVVWEPARI